MFTYNEIMPLLTGRALLEGTLVKGMSIMNSVIQASKLDMAFQNITSLADPKNPSDAATRYFVESSIAQAAKTMTVHLRGEAYTNVAHLPAGSYVITISSVNGGPAATFMISKNLSVKEAHVVRASSIPGEGSMEELDLKWAASGPLMLRKTALHYDGCYRLKII
jgi:hypothetical protein